MNDWLILSLVNDAWVTHIDIAKKSREAYRKDTYPYNGVYHFSADNAVGDNAPTFTRRIILFHETFAPLVPDKKLKATWKKEGKEVRSEEVTGTI